MVNVRLSNKAEQDIETITKHIASDSVDSASKFLDALAEILSVIDTFSQIGATYTIGGKQYHIFPISHQFREYLMIYSLDESGDVLIVRVVHGKRDLPALFG